MSNTLALYQRYTKWPFGKHLISAVVGMRAPYFSTIRLLILELAPGLCKVQIKDRRSIRNHFGRIHAVAMCTLSELTGGLAVDASLPSNLRWIPWLAFVIGGIIGVILVGAVLDWALIILSTLAGSSLIIDAIDLPQALSVIAFIALVLVGFLVQAKKLKREKR